MVNKPHQIIAWKVWHTLLIFLSAEYVVELFMKPG